MAGASPERRITPVILCGGAGTRLWPLSRLDRPKPLVALGGEETMLQLTAARVAGGEAFEAPVVVAGAEDADEIEAQLAAAGCPPALLIVEPCARSTAPAIALAALSAAPDALLLVMPSDHQVADAAAFRAAVAAAAPAARDGWLVTFGIVPDRPETGYGYIAQGGALGGGVFRAARFAEKPDAETAHTWLAEGGWHWNAGIFLLRADAYVEALETHAPDILAAARAALAGGSRSGVRLVPGAEAFAAAPSASVDRAVMERSDRVAVAPVEMGWSDIGSWDALHALGPHDADGNSVTGDGVAVGSRGCLIRTDGLTVVALGVEDLVIVATDRAVLVMPRKDSQRVKEAIDALTARGHRAPGAPPAAPSGAEGGTAGRVEA
ncbi:MAG: mannose-1-phosphate guanylyltransferase [Allosphingosinicella sp.]